MSRNVSGRNQNNVNERFEKQVNHTERFFLRKTFQQTVNRYNLTTSLICAKHYVVSEHCIFIRRPENKWDLDIEPMQRNLLKITGDSNSELEFQVDAKINRKSLVCMSADHQPSEHTERVDEPRHPVKIPWYHCRYISSLSAVWSTNCSKIARYSYITHKWICYNRCALIQNIL